MHLNLSQVTVGLFSLYSAITVTCDCKPDVTTTEHYNQIIDNYLSIWSGNYNLTDSTLSPDVTLFGDRFPSSTGNGSDSLSVHTSQDFLGFIERSRTGWDEYGFDLYKSASQDLNVAIRWIMYGVIGGNFALVLRCV